MKVFTYKRLQPEDMDAWFKFRIASLRESPTAFLASPEKELQQGVNFFRDRISEAGEDNLIFGCYDGKELLGTVGVVREFHQKSSHKAFIWGMYVLPEQRGSGIGGDLLRMAIEHARSSMKVRQITLSVESTRVAAKKLYASLGFKEWGTELGAICVDEQYYDEVYMSLDLTGEQNSR